MKMSGEVMGNPLDTETYQLDGKTYTLDPTTGGYIESPSATAGMDYQQLMTLGQAEMVQLYIDGATAAEDFAFAEEENGLRVSFTMPTETARPDAAADQLPDDRRAAACPGGADAPERE